MNNTFSAIESRSLLIGRALIAVVIFILVMTVSKNSAVLLFVLFGQGHFALTYIEQLRMGMYTWTSAAKYLLFAVFSFYILSVNPPAFILFVSIFFLLHNFFDDMRLLRTTQRACALLSTSSILLLLSALSADHLLKTHIGETAALISLFLLVMSLIFCVIKKALGDAYIKYILSVTTLLLCAYIVTLEVCSERLFAFIILTHYRNWYWHVYRKYKAIAPQRVKPYFYESLLVNLLIVGVFVGLSAYYGGPKFALESNEFFKLIYNPPNFYAWTLLHLMVTLRSNDYLPERK